MGNRMTHAAMHLSRDAVQKRIQGEQHPWRRQRWEIISQALATPRKAEDSARTVGVSPSTVHRVIAAYNHAGVAAIDTPGKGGRRHHYLTLEQEQILLQPFLARAARGEMVTAVEIKLALEARIGHEVNKSTLYRLLDRHGWQQIGAQASPAQAKAGKPVAGDMGPVREESRSTQGNAGALWKRREQQAPLNAQRKLSSRRYPSDLTDQQWAILEPLIPPAKEGGRPRTTDMRDVLNALFSVDRTGCQWRALPHDFPRGPPPGAMFAHGATMGPGNACIPPCVNKSVSSRVVSRRPARRSSIVNR
jgi:transposase